jgi:hypothetical protein
MAEYAITALNEHYFTFARARAGLPLLWALESKLDPQIPFKGLFAGVNLETGTLLGDFAYQDGTASSKAVPSYAIDPSIDNTIKGSLGLGKEYILHATNSSIRGPITGYSRFLDGRYGMLGLINHRPSLGYPKANAKFNHNGSVTTIAPIPKGHEIYASYGAGYRDRHNAKLPGVPWITWSTHYTEEEQLYKRANSGDPNLIAGSTNQLDTLPQIPKDRLLPANETAEWKRGDRVLAFLPDETMKGRKEWWQPATVISQSKGGYSVRVNDTGIEKTVNPKKILALVDIRTTFTDWMI